MKNRKVDKVIVMLTILLGIVNIFLVSKNYVANKEIDSIKNNTYAIFIETKVEDGEKVYEETRQSMWPTSRLVFSKSICEDNNGNKTENLVTYDKRNKIARLENNKTTLCNMYFDKDEVAPEIKSYTINGKDKVEEEEYITAQSVKLYFSWDDNDVAEYCITNQESSLNCNWIKTSEEDNANSVKSININEHKVTNGKQDICVVIRDFAENESRVRCINVAVDNTTPTADIRVTKQDGTAISNVNDWINQKVKFKLIGSEPGPSGTTIRYCIDTNNTCNPNTLYDQNDANEINLDNEGTFYIRYSNTSGTNLTSGVKYRKVQVDVTKPTISNFYVGKEKGGYTNSIDKPGATATFNDTPSGVIKYCIGKSNKIEECNTWGSVTSEKITNGVVPALNEGDKTYTRYLFVQDRAGNYAFASDTVTLDTKAPTYTVTEPNKNLGSGWSGGFSVTVTCKDGTATVSGGKTQTISGTSNVTVTGTCKDIAGNTSNYSISYKYNGCLTGSNTCQSGTKYRNCSDCYTGTPNECVGGWVQKYNSCKTTKCVGGYKSVNASRSYATKNCTCLCHGWTSWTTGSYWGNSCRSNCAGADNYSNSCSCPGGYPNDGGGSTCYKLTCSSGYLSGSSCMVYDNCKTTQCVAGYDDVWNSCKTTRNTCQPGCDSYTDPCATGSNTCRGGFTR